MRIAIPSGLPSQALRSSLQYSEAAMERQLAGQVGKTQPTIHTRRAISTLVSRKRKSSPAKPTRQQVSDCINIWAQVYQLSDRSDPADRNHHTEGMQTGSVIGTLGPVAEPQAEKQRTPLGSET
jgi:hypothetical protein